VGHGPFESELMGGMEVVRKKAAKGLFQGGRIETSNRKGIKPTTKIGPNGARDLRNHAPAEASSYRAEAPNRVGRGHAWDETAGARGVRNVRKIAEDRPNKGGR